MQEEHQENFFDLLGNLSAISCPHCHETTSGYSPQCEHCGAALETESDSPSLNISDGQPARLHKTPMHEAKNLIKLRQSIEDYRGGASLEYFLTAVGELLQLVDSALELYQGDFMKQRLSAMEAEPAKVYKQLAAGAKEMQLGLHAILAGAEPRDFPEIERGLARFEAGLWKIDAAQDQAIEKAEALDESGEE